MAKPTAIALEWDEPSELEQDLGVSGGYRGGCPDVGYDSMMQRMMEVMCLSRIFGPRGRILKKGGGMLSQLIQTHNHPLSLVFKVKAIYYQKT